MNKLPLIVCYYLPERVRETSSERVVQNCYQSLNHKNHRMLTSNRLHMTTTLTQTPAGQVDTDLRHQRREYAISYYNILMHMRRTRGYSTISRKLIVQYMDVDHTGATRAVVPPNTNIDERRCYSPSVQFKINNKFHKQSNTPSA
jgi:hypothetical protein